MGEREREKKRKRMVGEKGGGRGQVQSLKSGHVLSDTKWKKPAVNGRATSDEWVMDRPHNLPRRTMETGWRIYELKDCDPSNGISSGRDDPVDKDPGENVS